MDKKRKRTDLALSEHVKVINMLNDKMSQTEIAAKFGISQSQVSRIAKNQQEILNKWHTNDNPNRKRQRTGKDADVETALKMGFTSSRGRDVPLSGPDDDDDIQPPDALTTEEFEDFVAVDDTAPCHGMPTDEEICASVKVSDTANKGQSVDENVDTDSEDEKLPPPPTAAQAMAALKTLRHWMEIGNCTDFTAFYKLENTVQSMVAGRQQTKINHNFQ